MSGPAEYEIERVADILKVPREKWERVLADAIEWLEMQAAMKPLIDAGLVTVEPGMTWIDDDIVGLSRLELEVVAPPSTEGGEDGSR